MYEHHSQPLLSRTEWLLRLLKSFRVAAALMAVALTIGILGYHFLGDLSWVDVLLEAAMILSGMGPVSAMESNTVKIFASFYALMSGWVLITSAGVVMAPILHRFLHRFHRNHK